MKEESKKFIKVLVFMMLPLAGSGVDIYTPSLPSIQHIYGVDPVAVKQTVSLYLLGLAIGQFLFGTLSDAFGRKRFNVVGAGAFMLISALITWAPNLLVLTILRFCQGLVVGNIAANARSMVTDSFTEEEVKKLSPLMSLMWSLGPILAPLMGGVFQHYFNWKMSFYFLGVYACLLLMLFIRLPETNHRMRPLHIGHLLESYRQIICNAQYVQAVLLMSIGYSVLMYYAVSLPYFIQMVFHKSAMYYGFATTVIGLAYFFGAIINRWLMKRMLVESIINLAIVIMAMLGGVMLLLVSTHSIVVVYTVLSLITVAIAVLFPCCLFKCISLFPMHAGKASGLAGTMFIFVGSVSSMVFSHLNIVDMTSLTVPLLVIIAILVCIRIGFSCFFISNILLHLFGRGKS